MDQAVIEPALADAQQAGRFDLYAGVHKALRLYMTDTLARVGRADPADDDEVAGAIGQLRDLLELCDLHIEDENRFVLPALEARRPASPSATPKSTSRTARRLPRCVARR